MVVFMSNLKCETVILTQVWDLLSLGNTSREGFFFFFLSIIMHHCPISTIMHYCPTRCVRRKLVKYICRLHYCSITLPHLLLNIVSLFSQNNNSYFWCNQLYGFTLLFKLCYGFTLLFKYVRCNQLYGLHRETKC